MRICRFDDNRLGLIEGETLIDVTSVLGLLAPLRWPLPFGDALIANLSALRSNMVEVAKKAPRISLENVCLKSPVANPSKIIAAPGNYRAHVEIDTLDPEIDHGFHRATMLGVDRPVDKHGLFLKAASSLVGPGDGVTLGWPETGRRTDHEVEIAIVIGKTAFRVSRDEALDYVAGYSIALDLTARGTEDRSFRKSADSFAILGPCLATPDEIADPADLPFWLSVDGTMRQSSSTRAITVDIPELIEIASHVYTLYPGDIIMTGTPEGVGPLRPGEVMRAGAKGIGEMTVTVHGPAWA